MFRVRHTFAKNHLETFLVISNIQRSGTVDEAYLSISRCRFLGNGFTTGNLSKLTKNYTEYVLQNYTQYYIAGPTVSSDDCPTSWKVAFRLRSLIFTQPDILFI